MISKHTSGKDVVQIVQPCILFQCVMFKTWSCPEHSRHDFKKKLHLHISYQGWCRGQKTTYRNRFSPFTMWVRGIQVSHPAWWQPPLPAERAHRPHPRESLTPFRFLHPRSHFLLIFSVLLKIITGHSWLVELYGSLSHWRVGWVVLGLTEKWALCHAVTDTQLSPSATVLTSGISVTWGQAQVNDTKVKILGIGRSYLLKEPFKKKPFTPLESVWQSVSHNGVY